VESKSNRPLAVDAWHRLKAGDATNGTTRASNITKSKITDNPDEMTARAVVGGMPHEKRARC